MTGTLQVISIPEGANIYIDGTDTSYITPHTFVLSAKVYDFRLILQGYTDVYGTLTLSDNETLSLIAQMQSGMYKLYEKMIIIAVVGLVLSGIALMSSWSKK